MPDLRGRIPIHNGQSPALSNYVIGQEAGSENVSLITAQIPQHTHTVVASKDTATSNAPGPTTIFGTCVGDNFYATFATTPPPVNLAPTAISFSGQNLPHENCMPTLTMSYCVAWAGVFPSRS